MVIRFLIHDLVLCVFLIFWPIHVHGTVVFVSTVKQSIMNQWWWFRYALCELHVWLQAPVYLHWDIAVGRSAIQNMLSFSKFKGDFLRKKIFKNKARCKCDQKYVNLKRSVQRFSADKILLRQCPLFLCEAYVPSSAFYSNSLSMLRHTCCFS